MHAAAYQASLQRLTVISVSNAAALGLTIVTFNRYRNCLAHHTGSV